MARTKYRLTQPDLDEIAANATALAEDLASRITIDSALMQNLDALPAAVAINQLAMECTKVVNALLAKARHESDMARLEGRLRDKK